MSTVNVRLLRSCRRLAANPANAHTHISRRYLRAHTCSCTCQLTLTSSSSLRAHLSSDSLTVQSSKTCRSAHACVRACVHHLCTLHVNTARNTAILMDHDPQSSNRNIDIMISISMSTSNQSGMFRQKEGDIDIQAYLKPHQNPHQHPLDCRTTSRPLPL